MLLGVVGAGAVAAGFLLPALREQGVTDEQITTMLVDNPRRHFGG